MRRCSAPALLGTLFTTPPGTLAAGTAVAQHNPRRAAGAVPSCSADQASEKRGGERPRRAPKPTHPRHLQLPREAA